MSVVVWPASPNWASDFAAFPPPFETGGSGPGGTVVIGYLTSSLLLSDAVLSGGLRLAAASGTLPQRLTMATLKLINLASTASGSLTRPGLAWDDDGIHVWIADRGRNRVYRINSSLATPVVNLEITGSTTDPTKNTMSTPEGCTKGYDSRVWFCSQGTNLVGFIDTSTLRCEQWAIPGTPANNTPHHVIEHIAGKVLVRNNPASSAVYVEYSFNGTGSAGGLAYTGRQINDGTTYFDCIPDFSGNLYTLQGTSTTVIKRPAATLTASATFTTVNTYKFRPPGFGNILRVGYYDHVASKLLVRHASYSEMTIFDPASMSAEGVGWKWSEYDNPIHNVSTSYARPSVAVSPDGTTTAYFVDGRPGVNTLLGQYSVAFLRTGVQRARWTWTPTSPATVYTITVPGYFGASRGAVDSVPPLNPLGQEYDFRRVKFYYSTDGGSTRTEFMPSSASLGVVVSGTLTVDADFQWTPVNHFGAPPWISDGAGSGPTIVWSQS